MDIYKEIYDFAASAGALEGYLYSRQFLEAGELDDWIGNLVKQHRQLPEDVRVSFQGSLDRTLGRAAHSLVALLGENHGHVQALKSLIVGTVPASSRDFDTEKKEKAEKYKK